MGRVPRCLIKPQRDRLGVDAIEARPKAEAGAADEQALQATREARGGSAWESNPACPARRQRPLLKTGRATGPRSRPLSILFDLQ